MKRKILAVLLGVVCASGGVAVGAVVAHAQAAPTPEVDRANATMHLGGTLKPVTCTGEDSVGYETFFGAWAGSEAQVLPDPTDYSLTGALSVSSIVWTINTATARGVLTSKIVLTNSAGAVVYAGKLTLVTQGLPAAGTTVPARGWIVAAFKQPDETVLPGDNNLIANVEFGILSTGANGQFGDAVSSPGYPDFSAVTNVAPTAPDGVC